MATKETAPLAISKIRYDGTGIITVYDGLLQIPQGSGPATTNEDSALRKMAVANQMLRSLGYKVIGAASELFGQEDTRGADLLLGAVISNVRIDAYEPLAGNYIETTMDVTFELYDRTKKDVIFRQRETGFARLKGVRSSSGDEAFMVALTKVLARHDFVELVSEPRSIIDLAGPTENNAIQVENATCKCKNCFFASPIKSSGFLECAGTDIKALQPYCDPSI